MLGKELEFIYSTWETILIPRNIKMRIVFLTLALIAHDTIYELIRASWRHQETSKKLSRFFLWAMLRFCVNWQGQSFKSLNPLWAGSFLYHRHILGTWLRLYWIKNGAILPLLCAITNLYLPVALRSKVYFTVYLRV